MFNFLSIAKPGKKTGDGQEWQAKNQASPSHTYCHIPTDRYKQTEETKIGLLLINWSDQGLPSCHSICKFV